MPVFSEGVLAHEFAFTPAEEQLMFAAIATNKAPQEVLDELNKVSKKRKVPVVLDAVVDFMDRNRVNALHKELEFIAAQTRLNINMVLQVQEDLNTLEDVADRIQGRSETFVKQSKSTNRKIWYRSHRMGVIGGFSALVVILMIVLFIVI